MSFSLPSSERVVGFVILACFSFLLFLLAFLFLLFLLAFLFFLFLLAFLFLLFLLSFLFLFFLLAFDLEFVGQLLCCFWTCFGAAGPLRMPQSSEDWAAPGDAHADLSPVEFKAQASFEGGEDVAGAPDMAVHLCHNK